MRSQCSPPPRSCNNSGARHCRDACARTGKPLASAAALLIALGIHGNLPLRLQADHLTVAGERQHLQLEDGSKVLLNTNSAFSSRFNERQHQARLYKGEAFFEVAAERELPLEIDAGPVRASVSDTSFAVRYLDGEAQVQVQRGAVDLRTLDDSARLRLSAGNSVRVGPHGFGRPEKLDAQKDLAWVQGRLVFENCPMSQVLAELRRYYPGWIINNNEHLAQVAVTGNYRLDKPLDVVPRPGPDHLRQGLGVPGTGDSQLRTVIFTR
ncbi:Iron siderophore sensor protein [Pseudomonas sp. FEN]|nr:Iron siderophore sensor protein [Pseudomonas sp. FEN]